MNGSLKRPQRIAILGILSVIFAHAAITIGTTVPSGTVGQAYQITLVPSGGNAPYNNLVTAGIIPAGLTLSSAGVLSGTPQSPGLYSFSVQSTDATSVTGLTNLTLRVAGPTGLQISMTSLPDGKPATFYDNTLTAQGGTSPYSFDLVSGGGTLPAGLWITSVGRIYGTPVAAGVFPLNLRVTDSLGNSYQASMTLRITGTGLGLTTVSLAGASAGLPYSQTIAAVGGTGPYTFAIGTGALPAGLTLANTGLISGTANSAGTSNFSVQVTDSTGTVMESNYSLVVGNTIPQTATASIPNGVVNTGFSNTFRTQGGTGPYTYAIVNGNLPAGLTLVNGTVSGIPTASGAFPVTVRVTDAAGQSNTFDVLYNVNSSGFSIVPSPLPDAFVNTKFIGTLRTTGGFAPYVFLMSSTGALPPGVTLNMDGNLIGTPTIAGRYTFLVRAFDAGGQAAQLPVTITVQPAGQSWSRSGLVNGFVNQPYTSTLSVTNGMAPYVFTLISGTLPSGLTLAQNGNVYGIATTSGLFLPTIRVSDANGSTSQITVAIFVSGGGAAFSTFTLPSARQNQSYTTTLQATGGTGPYTFELAAGTLPQGLTLTPAGVLSGVPGGISATPFTIRLTDGTGATSLVTYFFDINGSSLALTGALPGSGQVGQPYRYSFAATGGTGPTTFVLDSGALPPGLTLNENGTLSGTPTAAGTYLVKLKTTDANGASSQFTQVIVIGSTGLAFASNAVSDGTVGSSYSANLSGIGGAGPYTYALVSGTLPAGITLGSNGAFSGTPTASGTFPVTLRITDSAGATATMALTLVVRATAALTVGSTLPSAAPGRAYSFQLIAGGGQAPYTFMLASGSALPAGLMLSSPGILSGLPTTAGMGTFTVIVQDASGATATQVITLNVASSTITIPNATLPNGTVGGAYSLTLSPAGGMAPYTVAVVSGTLPAGVVLSGAGVFSGMPTTPGIYPVIIRVTDANGAQVQQPYVIVVAPLGGLIITTATLPIATMGQIYSGSLQATGGTGPYTFAIATGTLPAGLILSSTGAITGLATATGQFLITFRVIDVNGTMATATLSLVAK
ncbi:MAG: Ig domain-containing protein [Bryobacteraceae bacterium]|nr:Ig domain-containing protein [Bryobacteraceae bacterium]